MVNFLDLLAGLENGQAAQTPQSLEGQSLEGASLEGQSLESLPLDGPAKHRQKTPFQQQPERTAELSSPDVSDWMEGFDIRRAVVWSEILRPKFKEDEQDGIDIPY